MPVFTCMSFTGSKASTRSGPDTVGPGQGQVDPLNNLHMTKSCAAYLMYAASSKIHAFPFFTAGRTHAGCRHFFLLLILATLFQNIYFPLRDASHHAWKKRKRKGKKFQLRSGFGRWKTDGVEGRKTHDGKKGKREKAERGKSGMNHSGQDFEYE